MEQLGLDEIHDCVIKLRVNPRRRREKVYIGCGAGFAGDRPMAALKLLQRVKELDYLVLECLAERTLAERYQIMLSGGDGYDSRISDWMRLLLPLAVERGTCIITNMGAIDPLGAQEKVLQIATCLGLSISVVVAHEVSPTKPGSGLISQNESFTMEGWNWNDLKQLAQGSLAGHLLECGCQLTGGYFMHPGDKYRDMTFPHLLDVSLPYAVISFNGEVCVEKAEGSGGVLSFGTCAEQLLYEVGDPQAYATPDVILDFCNVSFRPLSSSKVLCVGSKTSTKAVPDKLLRLIPMDCGWKGWGEISYGGHECVKRAEAAEFLVRSWMEETYSDVNDSIMSYIIGVDSLKATSHDNTTASPKASVDVRLRMDGLFEQKEHAVQFCREFTALYTNGPAGGGGISTGHKKEIILEKQLVERQHVFWRTGVKSTAATKLNKEINPTVSQIARPKTDNSHTNFSTLELDSSPAPPGKKLPLYAVAHSRAGDKGNDLNLSVIPHFLPDIERLKLIITPQWVKEVVSNLLNTSSFPDRYTADKRNEQAHGKNVEVEVYEVEGISSLNIVVRNILDGGVNCSRRIDRHGKTVSDVILCQQVVLP
ncbi:hypothetical protein ACFE04_018151 [Oxalis oulophora]